MTEAGDSRLNQDGRDEVRLPSLLGNVPGGVGLVALINHAQVREDR